MVGSLDLPLPRNLFSILLLQVSMWGADSFLVIGPPEPIVAVLGADTVLPCRVAPAMSLENMELRWFRSQFSDAVYVYQDGVEQAGEQLVDFKGRTELVKDYITEGRVAVRIHSLRGSDNGTYTCFFKKGSDFEETILELKVIGLGSGPRIFMVGPEGKRIRLKCTGKRWFPQPEVQWKDARGEKIPSLSEDETQDDDGLFQTEASLIVTDSSKVSCCMKNPFFGQEQVETISIPESLEKELARRMHLYQQDWRKAELYADWRKEHFEAVAITLDPETVHRNLVLSESRRHVSSIENVPQNNDAPTHQGPEESETIFSVLGQNSFKMGRHYWEVEVSVGTEVGPGARWALGVCSETMKREGWFVESPEKNFWVVAYKEEEIRALTSQPKSLLLSQCPQKIGIFLDGEAGNVSFYNMADGSHIHSFTGITFCGTLRPYFSLQGAGISVTIRSASGHTENCPDSSPKTSVTYLRSFDMGAPQEANSLLPPKIVSAP